MKMRSSGCHATAHVSCGARLHASPWNKFTSTFNDCATFERGQTYMPVDISLEMRAVMNKVGSQLARAIALNKAAYDQNIVSMAIPSAE